MIRAIIGLLVIALGFVILIFFAAITQWLYEYLRGKYNRPKIGAMKFSSKMIKRNDYLGFKDEVKQFDHISRGDEYLNPLSPPTYWNKTDKGHIAFQGRGLCYQFYTDAIIMECKFIYGKYGLKWALNTHYASIAKSEVEKYIERN